jgi:hypothetical protein
VIDNGPPPPMHYFAVGVADAAADCPTPQAVTLDHATFGPKSIGTKASQLAVVIGTSTKYNGNRCHTVSCASMKAGDRLTGHLDRTAWHGIY